MDLGLYIAASGMVAEQIRQDQLSNDLANASTPGYKPDQSPQHSFGEVLVASTPGGAAVGSVDEGVALGKTYTDMTPGRDPGNGRTARLRDPGQGFFAVQTAQGMRYTRDGQFTSTAGGRPHRRERQSRCSARAARRSRSAPTGSGRSRRARRLRSARRGQAGRKPLHGHGRRQAGGHRAPGRAGGLGRGRREGDGRHDHLAAQLPVGPAGDPGDRADAAGGRLAGRLAGAASA